MWSIISTNVISWKNLLDLPNITQSNHFQHQSIVQTLTHEFPDLAKMRIQNQRFVEFDTNIIAIN